MSGLLIFILGIYSHLAQTANGQCYGSCPDGWITFKGSCYYIAYEQKSSFIESVHFCQQHNAKLIEIETSLENSFVKDLLKKTQVVDVWLGLTDISVEGVYRWYSNSQIAYFKDWDIDQPDSRHGNEDCAVFHGPTLQWHDYSCTDIFHPLCEKSFNTGVAVIG